MEKLNTVLIVDDDFINNFLTARVLKKLNIADNIKIMMNGHEGMVYLRENCQYDNARYPELIFLDINMPVMDGFDFIRAFECLPMANKSEIIILTTSGNAGDIQKISELGEYKLVNKPLTREKLLDCLAKVG